jgi:hypothetical protein
MALVLDDRVKETSTTTGTGTLDLSGAVSGFQTFVAGIGNSNTTYYAIVNRDEAEWETGVGTVTDASTDTLARTTVIASSNSDSAVNFSAGTKDVFATLPASKVVYEDAGSDVTLPDDLILGSDSSVLKFGADSDTTLTHTDGTGLTLNSTNKLTFGDSATFVHQSSDGVMTIDGEATIDLNASTAVLVSNDLKLNSDSAVLGFGADNDTTLTHTDGTGLTLNSTNKLLFRDTGLYVYSSTDGQLDLVADTEIQIAATTIDINGAVDISGNTTVGGDLTVTGDDITMSTNTSGAALIADGTNFNPVVISGDISIATNGAASIAANSVDGTHIALGSDAQGDVMYYNGTNWARLGVGTSGQFLKTQGSSANPVWADTTGTITALNSATANELVTVGGTTTELDAEANLTFTGSALTCIGTITVGVDNTGHDVKFFGATSGSYWLWDEDADGVVQIGTLTVGVDDAGHDVKFFGNAASAYMLWDTSADDLILAGGAGLIVPESQFTLGSTAVTSTAAELNLLDTASANSVVNSKAVIYGSSGELAGTLSTAAQTNVTSLGTLTALTVDDVAVNGKVVTMTGSSSDTAVFTAGTNGTLSIVTTDAAAAAANIQITADGTAELAGTTVTLDSAADIELEATDDINVPSGVGMTFGNDGEKIEGDGSDLTISGNTVNLDSSMNHTFSSTGKAMVLGL